MDSLWPGSSHTGQQTRRLLVQDEGDVGNNIDWQARLDESMYFQRVGQGAVKSGCPHVRRYLLHLRCCQAVEKGASLPPPPAPSVRLVS